MISDSFYFQFINKCYLIKMFDFVRFSIVLLLIRIFSVRSEDVFIMSEHNCMTNSSLPIISNSPLKDIQNKNIDYLHSNDKMYNNFDDGECGDYCSGSWNIKNSISIKNSEIIIDRRWEDLKTYFLPVDDKKLYFEPTNINIPKNDFKIPMSIRGREIHIFFCTEGSVTSKCVWFILQGWGQNKSAIRQCKEDEIPTKLNKYPQGECEKARNETEHKKAALFLFEDHWSHIFVQKQNNTWSIIHNALSIISFDGSNLDPYYKNLILHAKTINALVKIHDYKFLSTTNEKNVAWGPEITPEMSCLKLFIKMCYKCSLKITLQINMTTIFDREYKEPKWKEITINLPKRDMDGSFYFITKSNNATSPFWAVDNISKCPENDVREITRRAEADCELVDGFGSHKLDQETYKNAKINTESNCKDDQLGFDSCFPCTGFTCGPKKYCQFKFPQLKCACPPGSSVFNDECRRCSDGYYGIECRKTCPGCKSGCKYNGKCESGVCNSCWRGDNCDIPTYPVYVNTPTVQNITPTTAKFIFNNFTLFGDGKESAYRYIIQLKEKSSFYWKDIDQNYTGINYNKVYDNLKPETTYLVRAIVNYTDNNPIDKYFEFNTTCKDIERNQIQVTSYNTSVNLEFQPTSESCNFKKYTINGININANHNTITNLEPNTDYEFKIKGRNDINIQIKTSEGLSSPVKNIKVDNITSNSAFISWTVPEKPKGKILGYHVIYLAQKSREFGCPSLKNTEIFNEKITDTRKFVGDLKPYMVYVVKVIPYNGAGDGMEASISFETLQIDTISKSNYNLLSNQEDVEMQFKYEKCKEEGPLFASAIITCLSKWCQNETGKATKNISDDQKFVIRGLIPYTDYDVQVHLSRFSDGRNAYLIRDNFTTLESVPNPIRHLMVYSIIKKGYDTNKVSLRWLPPWPPQSKISHFKINYSYYTWPSTYRYSSKCVNSPCKIWKDYICCTIDQNIYFDKIYTFQVTAVNYQYQESPFKELQHKIEKQTTRVPYNVITEWNDENKLKLSWNHPNFTYGGPITHFIYQINGISDIFNIGEENLTYTKDNIDVELEQEITIKIKACNSECSYNTEKKDFSPPPKADIPNEIESTSFNYTINLTLPKINKICYKCKTIILLAIAIEDNKTIDFDKNVIFEYDLDHKEETFLIGNGSRLYSKYLKKTILSDPLKSGSYYNLSIRVINTYKNRKSVKTVYYKVYTTGDPDVHLDKPKKFEKTNSNMAYITLLILPIIAAGIFIYIKKKRKLTTENDDQPVPNPTHKEDETLLLNTVVHPPNVIIKPQVKQKPKIKKSYKKPNTTHSKLVMQDRFEKYIKSSLQNDDLRKQHALFPKGQVHPWIYAARKENKPKNRYSNLLAYDHSRVILEKINGDEFSDYINANYIDSYDTINAYIATQGPKPNTLNDFWRMIWQENVRTILMMANLMENEKKKVEKYWPDINEESNFGHIKVVFVAETVYANYVQRDFMVKKDGEERPLTQLHFNSWPDHGIPLYSQSLVPFLKKLLDIEMNTNSPIVVHCSAGVGRTGTIILCDMTLRLAKAERKIDILNYLDYIRSRRPNMVDNYEQYKLVHMVVLECLNGMNTTILCSENMPMEVNHVIKFEVEEQMKYLRDIEWQDHAMKSIISDEEKLPLNSDKNRRNSVVPEIGGRIYLNPYPTSDEASTYINAVYVEGFLNPNRFIATQHPLPNTLADFWRMVVQMDCSVIINLNELNPEDETSVKFWPDVNQEMSPVDHIKLQNVKTEDYELFQIICLHVSVKQETFAVDLILYNNWKSNEIVPNLQQFVGFMEESDSLLRKSNPAIITCYDGVTACGLFLTMSFLIEKMKLEQQCDVCQAVRYVRHNRKRFISKKEQFVFLYQAAVEYIRGFQSYANFT